MWEEGMLEKTTLDTANLMLLGEFVRIGIPVDLTIIF